VPFTFADLNAALISVVMAVRACWAVGNWPASILEATSFRAPAMAHWTLALMLAFYGEERQTLTRYGKLE
jgi:hypothetical protein